MTARVGTDGGGPKAAKSIGGVEEPAAKPDGGALLEELGEVVERGKKAWREVGAALDEIRKGLYKEGGYESFEGYVRGKHKMEKAYAYKLITAARAYRDVREKSPIGDSLVSVAQALAVAPLARKDARRAAEVLEGHAAEHGGVLPSARSIEAAVYREPGMGLVPEGGEQASPQEWLPVPPTAPVGGCATVVAGFDQSLQKWPNTRAESYAKGGKNSVRREAEKKARDLRNASAPPVLTSKAGEDVFVHHGDFGGFPVEPGSARLVFADPPYNRPWTEEHAPRLAAFARDALEEGGFFVCYTGDAYALDLANAAKDAGLNYYGFIWIMHRGGKDSLHHPRKTVPGKLAWVFAKGQAKLSSPYRGMADCGDAALKDDHEWQQALGEAEQIIEDFTSPGDLVIDPCLGSGTAAVAAGFLGRRAIGIEKDEATHRAAHRKVSRNLLAHSEFGRELADLAVKAAHEKLPFAEFVDLCRDRGVTEERLREIGAESAARREAHLQRNPHERWQRPRTEKGQALLLIGQGVSPSRARSAWRGDKGEAA